MAFFQSNPAIASRAVLPLRRGESKRRAVGFAIDVGEEVVLGRHDAVQPELCGRQAPS
jgi:hypothetical protein